MIQKTVTFFVTNYCVTKRADSEGVFVQHPFS